MKIVALLGSPRRNGNTTSIARQVMREAEALGAETQEFMLNNLRYSGCQACLGCKRTDRCVINDELTPVLDAVRGADAIIFATPVYFGETTGQFKSCFDRLYSFVNADYTSRFRGGVRSVFVLSQGATEESFADIYPRYTQWFDMFGFGDRYLIRTTSANTLGEAAARPEVVAQCSQIAQLLVADEN